MKSQMIKVRRKCFTQNVLETSETIFYQRRRLML